MDKTVNLLLQIENSKDGSEIEGVLGRLWKFGLSEAYVPSLANLLKNPHHVCHEDIVGAFQKLKDGRAVQALTEAVQYRLDYLAYDDSFGLARKCTWALADIGTKEARDSLMEIAKDGNQMIAGYAQKRLDNWEEEKSRKGR